MLRHEIKTDPNAFKGLKYILSLDDNTEEQKTHYQLEADICQQNQAAEKSDDDGFGEF